MYVESKVNYIAPDEINLLFTFSCILTPIFTHARDHARMHEYIYDYLCNL